MAKKEKLFKSNTVPSVLLVLTVIGAILFRASRSNWVFIGTTVGFNALPVTLLCLMAVCAALLGIYLRLKLTDNAFCQKKICRAVFVITTVF